MPLASKYDGKCKSCGTSHNKGDMIDQNELGNWCRYGKSCTGEPQGGSSIPQPIAAPPLSRGVTDEEKLDFAETAVTRFIKSCGIDEEHLVPLKDIAGQLGAVWNTAIIAKK